MYVYNQRTRDNPHGGALIIVVERVPRYRFN